MSFRVFHFLNNHTGMNDTEMERGQSKIPNITGTYQSLYRGVLLYNVWMDIFVRNELFLNVILWCEEKYKHVCFFTWLIIFHITENMPIKYICGTSVINFCRVVEYVPLTVNVSITVMCQVRFVNECSCFWPVKICLFALSMNSPVWETSVAKLNRNKSDCEFLK